jgi:uncharacterized membrane protein YhfC
VPLTASYTLATFVAIACMVVGPPLLALWVRARQGVGWRYFGLGALTFFLSQMLTRVPLVQVIQAAIAPTLQASVSLQWAWVAVLALTAGLFEEIGRYLVFRWMSRREQLTWSKTVMFGVGHGGLESMLLVAGITLITYLSLSSLTPETLQALSPEQRAAAEQQLAVTLAAPGWAPFVAVWERAWAMTLHVAFSVLVLQVFARGSLRWLFLAIAAHAVVDGVAAGLSLLLGASFATILVIEAVLAVFGVFAVWLILQFRTPARVGVDLAPSAS